MNKPIDFMSFWTGIFGGLCIALLIMMVMGGCK